MWIKTAYLLSFSVAAINYRNFTTLNTIGTTKPSMYISCDTEYLKTCAVMAEWLRRWTWNPMGSPLAGSNPAHCGFFMRSNLFGHITSGPLLTSHKLFPIAQTEDKILASHSQTIIYHMWENFGMGKNWWTKQHLPMFYTPVISFCNQLYLYM